MVAMRRTAASERRPMVSVLESLVPGNFKGLEAGVSEEFFAVEGSGERVLLTGVEVVSFRKSGSSGSMSSRFSMADFPGAYFGSVRLDFFAICVVSISASRMPSGFSRISFFLGGRETSLGCFSGFRDWMGDWEPRLEGTE